MAPSIGVSAGARKAKGANYSDLTWSGATGDTVVILRDGVPVADKANIGSYTDSLGKKTDSSYRYQVCETGGDVCSAEVVLNF